MINLIFCNLRVVIFFFLCELCSSWFSVGEWSGGVYEEDKFVTLLGVFVLCF